MLTEEIGHPAHQQHLHALIALMKASANWGLFQRMVERSFCETLGKRDRFHWKNSSINIKAEINPRHWCYFKSLIIRSNSAWEIPNVLKFVWMCVIGTSLKWLWIIIGRRSDPSFLFHTSWPPFDLTWWQPTCLKNSLNIFSGIDLTPMWIYAGILTGSLYLRTVPPK